MNKYLALFLIGIFMGCNSYEQNNTVEELVLSELNKKYNNALVFFGKNKVDHFPVKIEDKNSSFTDSFSPELGNLELVLLNYFESSYASHIISEFEEKSISIYNATDSCLLVVNRFVSRDDYYEVKPTKSELKLVDRDCYSDFLPIPNFWHSDYTTEETSCKLPEDFKIYVIEAKSGKHFEEKYLTDGRFMPSKWKNGYSKGVAISKKRKVIIYWLIIW